VLTGTSLIKLVGFPTEMQVGFKTHAGCRAGGLYAIGAERQSDFRMVTGGALSKARRRDLEFEIREVVNQFD
jgi:hypothetical protein